MSIVDQYLKNNEEYASRFPGPLPAPPSHQVAVVACMDCRMDIYGFIYDVTTGRLTEIT